MSFFLNYVPNDFFTFFTLPKYLTSLLGFPKKLLKNRGLADKESTINLLFKNY
jgi:hypothetical protein